jgi:hypothetical protein
VSLEKEARNRGVQVMSFQKMEGQKIFSLCSGLYNILRFKKVKHECTGKASRTNPVENVFSTNDGSSICPHGTVDG